MNIKSLDLPSDELPTDVRQTLDTHLDLLREACKTLVPSPLVEQRLQVAFAARQRSLQRQSWWTWLSPAVGLASSLAMVAWVVLSPLSGAPVRSALKHSAVAAFDDEGLPFVALQPLERIALETSTHVIAASLPRLQLASLGIPVTPENAGDNVRAELLVAANGSPLALRLTP